MLASVSLVAGVAQAGARPIDPADDIQLLEWRRGDVAAVADAARGADPAARRAAARALGRLGRAEALPYLERMKTDGDAGVRLAVAEALGYTPGASDAIRIWLDEEAPAGGWGALAQPRGDVRPMLFASLGRQGDASDIDRLVAGLSEPLPVGTAAAEGIGRLGRRGVTGLGGAVPSLVAALRRPDPRLVEAAAYALRRVGMADVDPADVDAVADGWAEAPTGPARAWLLRAVWPELDVRRRAASFDAAMEDAEPVVRIAALDAVGAGDVAPAKLVERLDDRHSGVRTAATAALGRVGGEDAAKALARRAEIWGPWTASEAVAALVASGRAPDAGLALEGSAPEPVRAAVAASLTDVDVLRKLVQDPSPMVRSSAATALSALGSRVPLDDLLAMLASEDLVVRQVSMELLGKRDGEAGAIPQPIVQPVLRQLRVDPDPDVMSLGFELLASRASRRPKDFDAKDSLLRDTLVRGVGHPDANVRDPATRLSAALHIDLGEVPRRDDVSLPGLDEALQVASARVFTTKGEFRIELEPEVAPLAVVNFARLAESNFYDGVVWHRVVPGFVVQTGDPRGDGSGGPGWTLPDEVSALPYDEGAIGMARSGPDTGGSQWFVTIEPQPHLVGDYTRFGHVSSGMHVVRALERGDRVLDVVVERVPTDG